MPRFRSIKDIVNDVNPWAVAIVVASLVFAVIVDYSNPNPIVLLMVIVFTYVSIIACDRICQKIHGNPTWAFVVAGTFSLFGVVMYWVYSQMIRYSVLDSILYRLHKQ